MWVWSCFVKYQHALNLSPDTSVIQIFPDIPVTHQQVNMGNSYSSQQFGIFNMSISNLSVPSMFLGICVVLSLWFCCRIKKECRLCTRRHETQSEALKNISETVSQHPAIRAPHLAIRAPAEPMFHNLWWTDYHYHFRPRMTNSNISISMGFNITNVTLVIIFMIYMDAYGRDWPRQQGKSWSPGSRSRSRSSTSTIPTSPSISSTSQAVSTTTEPARPSPSSYSSETDKYPVAMLLLVVGVLGTAATGVSLCAYKIWTARGIKKQRKIGQNSGQHKETIIDSVQDVVDWNF